MNYIDCLRGQINHGNRIPLETWRYDLRGAIASRRARDKILTGKHYNWHRRWVIDLAAHTATHDSRLVVHFERATDAPAYDGRAVNLQTWLNSQSGKMPAPDLAKHAARLMREAGQAYQRALKNGH